MKMLFIGGPWDQQEHSVEDPAPFRLVVPEAPPNRSALEAMTSGRDVDFIYRNVHYQKMRERGKDGRVREVYVVV